MCNGVFDRFPRLKIIIGHMGELIPYCLTRLNVSLTLGNWLAASQKETTSGSEPRQGMEKNVSYYMHENIFITTSGVFDQPVFDCARSVLGIDNILFSVDEPFRDSFEAVDFLNSTHLTTEQREKLAHGNAERLLKLPPLSATGEASTQVYARAQKSSLYTFGAKAKSKLGRALLSFMVK
jgi:predicted TIM-barrel fold metal-dependent hydrolase